MKQAATWQSIRAEGLKRIHDGLWAPGARIPDEADLAGEFGCARATVNRALRSLAEDGFLERRRKGGTRVALTPVRKAIFEIAIIRQDVEARGQLHGYRLVEDDLATMPHDVAAALELPPGSRMRHVRALHMAGGTPFCIEDRWLNPQLAGAEEADFAIVSANEWLVRNVAFSAGTIAFLALAADPEMSMLLGCRQGDALFAIERTTRSATAPITFVRLIYAPGHRMEARL